MANIWLSERTPTGAQAPKSPRLRWTRVTGQVGDIGLYQCVYCVSIMFKIHSYKMERSQGVKDQRSVFHLGTLLDGLAVKVCFARCAGEYIWEFEEGKEWLGQLQCLEVLFRGEEVYMRCWPSYKHNAHAGTTISYRKKVDTSKRGLPYIHIYTAYIYTYKNKPINIIKQRVFFQH